MYFGNMVYILEAPSTPITTTSPTTATSTKSMTTGTPTSRTTASPMGRTTSTLTRRTISTPMSRTTITTTSAARITRKVPVNNVVIIYLVLSRRATVHGHKYLSPSIFYYIFHIKPHLKKKYFKAISG